MGMASGISGQRTANNDLLAANGRTKIDGVLQQGMVR